MNYDDDGDKDEEEKDEEEDDDDAAEGLALLIRDRSARSCSALAT